MGDLGETSRELCPLHLEPYATLIEVSKEGAVDNSVSYGAIPHESRQSGLIYLLDSELGESW